MVSIFEFSYHHKIFALRFKILLEPKKPVWCMKSTLIIKALKMLGDFIGVFVV